MKTLFILSMTLLTTTSFATSISSRKQLEIAQKEAKEVRRDLHISGHDNVATSTPELISKTDLDYHYEDNKSPYHEDPLEDEQISKLYQCFHSKTCALWSFASSGEYWGGYGTSMHFVLINLKTSNYKQISHLTYAE